MSRRESRAQNGAVETGAAKGRSNVFLTLFCGYRKVNPVGEVRGELHDVAKIGFTPAKLIFDPASGQVSGFVNETRIEEFVAQGTGTIAYGGLEARTADPTFFAHANYFRVTRLSELGAEPRLQIEHSGVGSRDLKLTWPATANSFVLEQGSSANRFGPWKSLWRTNIVGNEITVTNSATNDLGIFRLREL